MKAKLLIVFFTLFGIANAQNTWTQKADFIGQVRAGTAGFSIGTKGYFCTGLSPSFTPMSDLWEYDPSSNSWTQKADFPGTARYFAASFSIGDKGYVGLGRNSSGNYESDFWEYDPASNTWTQKADFPGIARGATAGFSIGTKGYVGTGANLNTSTYYTDFWEWDQTTNTWTQKANFGGVGRGWAVGFSIGTKGYIGTGSSGGLFSPPYYGDFWEWDQNSNSWTQKTDFGGTARTNAAGFSIGNMGYIGTGWDNSVKQDFWEFDPSLNVWVEKAIFGGNARSAAGAFSIGTNGYIGTGGDNSTFIFYSDFWEYTPSAGIDEFNDQLNFSFSPNPFSTETILETNKVFRDVYLIIYSSSGKIVKQIKNISGNKIKIERGNLCSGLYFYELIQDNKKIRTGKLVIID